MEYETRIEKSKGYSGKLAGKSYLAAITGLDDVRTFAREFIEPAEIEWPANFAWSRKPKATRTDIYRVGAGLYERVEYDARTYILVDDEVTVISPDHAREIARTLGEK